MKKLFLLIALALTMSVGYTMAEEPTVYTSGDFQYVLKEDGTAEITDYTAKAATLEIPTALDGYAVTSIGDKAFYLCSSLTNITIPDDIIIVGSNPFASCTALVTIKVSPDHPTLATIDGVLFDKTEKRLICYPCASSAEHYDIPQGIRSIDNFAFRTCHSLKSITIPNSVSIIGDQAFEGCNHLLHITVPNSITVIGSYAFKDCDSLSTIAIPNSITTIGEWAFYSCDSLATISIPNRVTQIEIGVFAFCSSLSSITLPESISSIGDGAFMYCSKDLTFTVPRNSYAAQWAKENNVPYTYPDANDWLLN